MADRKNLTAPAAHLVSVRGAPGGGGVLVGHTLCDTAEVFVPWMPGVEFCLAIDVIQAVVGHTCPVPETLPDDPAAWVTP